MSKICGVLIAIFMFAIPVMSVILIVRLLGKKPCKKLGKVVLICICAIIPLTIVGVLTDTATWCDHDREVISETPPTCTEKGTIVEYCSECDIEVTKHTDKLPHNYQLAETVEATCTQGGHTLARCEYCLSTKKTNTSDELGHSMKEFSRIESTEDTEGKVVTKCERCGHEESKVIPKKELTPGDDGFISSNVGGIGGEILPDIKSDNLVNELIAIGFTKDEATANREIFLKCGVDSIEGAAPTDPNANIDGLVAYRIVLDDDRTLWFTIDRRELFYIALNGVDVYDTDKGGFLININDIHIPENDVSVSTANTLKDLTIHAIEPYFKNALYFDGFRYGRSDDKYMVQCEVYAQNGFGVKDWIFAKVWYEFDGTKFGITAIVIDGVRYK